MTLQGPHQRRLLGYATAFAGPAAITLLLLSVQHLLSEKVNSAPYLFAVLIAAWSGGFGPAVLATALSSLALDYFFLPPARSLWLTFPDFVWIVVFMSVSLIVAGLTAGRRDAAARAAMLLEQEQAARAAADVAKAEREALLLAAERDRREAEAANRMKDEFLAMLGHELRNPLSAVSCAAALLGRVGIQGKSALRAHEIIDRGVQHLARLVDDLLDVGRAMTDKITVDRRPLDLAEIVDRSTEHLDTAGRTAGHHLVVEREAVWIDGDEIRIEQVVVNLLTNALKYTPAGGTIRVSVTGDERDAVLRVADSGIGIPREKLSKIFDLFFQGEWAAGRSQGGLGIGLTLVRRLVELHGGTVTASSDGPGTGSTFTVRLPLARRPEMAQPGVTCV